MNRLFTDKGPEFSILTVLLLAVFSTPAVANRPAMEERSATGSAGEMPAAEENIPESPSSVEIMMQQQTRQSGDIVQLPAKEMQPGETLKIKLLDFPRRGMSMQQVQQEFGQPMAASEAVGKPPITSWTYPDRIVYFEYSTVLHVVAR